MAKTYTALTPGNATAGNAILASDHSAAFTNINNLRVPPICILTAPISGVALGGGDIPTTIGAGSVTYTEVVDTDEMFTSGVNITIKTAGLYVVSLSIIGDNIITVRGDIIHNSTTVAREHNATANPGAINATAIISAAVNDTVKATGSCGGTSGGVRFSATWLGQVS